MSLLKWALFVLFTWFVIRSRELQKEEENEE